MNCWPYGTQSNSTNVDITQNASSNLGYEGHPWQAYAQSGPAPGHGAAQPPLPTDYSYPPPTPGALDGPPPLPQHEWSSTPVELGSDAPPPLPEQPPLPQQSYINPSNAWAPPDLLPGPAGSHAATPQQPPGASLTPYPGTYYAGAASALQSITGHSQMQTPWSQQGVNSAPTPWAMQPAPPGAYPQQQYPGSGYQPQPFQNQAPYGQAQQAPGGPPNPYAQMYGQQGAWRGAHGYQQPPAAHNIASGYGAPYSAGQYAQVYGHQQSGWAARTGQSQQPSWAAAPQPTPAANGYGQHQPPLPDAASPAQLAEVRPAHADVPDRKSVLTNVSPVEDLLTRPGRAKRPKLIAVVIRGLPGSGKSLIARRLRDAEVEAGGSGPRIHCIDDYFVTEVEKEVWEKDASGKQRLKRVQETEYCFEADMEGVYKASLLKAFRRTVEEGRSTFVIVDAPNPRVEDFKPYWDAGQRAGYEVYVLQAPETDPKVCFKRNVHGRTLEDIRAAASQWEAAPPSYPQLDPSWLLRPSGKPQAGITEVDMEDEVSIDGAQLDPESLAAARAKGRWASLDDGADVPQQKPKKMQKGRFTETAKASGPRSEGAWKPKKKVRWADEAEEEDTGFHIGGASLRQLETVYVLEGLGPPKEQSYGQKSFSDQVTAEHKSEQHNFRDILLGKRIPA
ncbi:probable YLP motif-containing protein 1 at C-terminar half [Coccomyxa sp. Obi]|nr:probable YLP motif-containing protein 1 at C-terminar half [Coccomyxa sp. Obi]